jgi:aspartate kinase
MARLVLKFGGTSIAGIDEINAAADKIAAEVARGNEVAVVVSAMAGVTNQLIEYCRQMDVMHDAREYDTVVSSGETVTSGLMAMALQRRGIEARSWQGWQIPISCDDVHGRARILDIDTSEMSSRMKDGEVGVLAGFQGVTAGRRVTTLGRGGSDTTAVALAASLGADRCDIYTDVDGVYTTDPRIVPNARKINRISYEEMLEMASSGAKVLQTRSVEMAMKRNVPVQVLYSFGEEIGSDLPGTLVTEEDMIVEKEVVNGITCEQNEAKVTLINVPDIPGIAAKIFGPLADADINVDMIVQNFSQNGTSTDVTFTVPAEEIDRAVKELEACKELESAEIRTDSKVVKISVIGIGMVSHAGVAQTMFTALAEKGINIYVISTSEIKISVLISEEYAELAVRALHAAYGMEESES